MLLALKWGTREDPTSGLGSEAILDFASSGCQWRDEAGDMVADVRVVGRCRWHQNEPVAGVGRMAHEARFGVCHRALVPKRETKDAVFRGARAEAGAVRPSLGRRQVTHRGTG